MTTVRGTWARRCQRAWPVAVGSLRHTTTWRRMATTQVRTPRLRAQVTRQHRCRSGLLGSATGARLSSEACTAYTVACVHGAHLWRRPPDAPKRRCLIVGQTTVGVVNANDIGVVGALQCGEWMHQSRNATSSVGTWALRRACRWGTGGWCVQASSASRFWPFWVRDSQGPSVLGPQRGRPHTCVAE